WLSEWGGLDLWGRYLDEGFVQAKLAGDVDGWVKGVMEHADRGRLLAAMVDQMDANIPAEMWKIRNLWRQQMVMARRLFKGLILIEVRVDPIRPGPFNV
ncbi:hypothetical protein BDN72DRAFT_722615, partial [Pluteus cervinus]